MKAYKALERAGTHLNVSSEGEICKKLSAAAILLICLIQSYSLSNYGFLIKVGRQSPHNALGRGCVTLKTGRAQTKGSTMPTITEEYARE